MLADSKAYSGIAVNDLEKAKEFYGETLGLKLSVLDERFGLMTLHLAGERDTLVYHSPDITPASYTILNFPVDDIGIDRLRQRRYPFLGRPAAGRLLGAGRPRQQEERQSDGGREDPAGKHGYPLCSPPEPPFPASATQR